MEALGSDSGARTAFAERLALLYQEAGNPPLKRVAEAVGQLQRVDDRGRPVRVSAQRISDWRRARNVPAHFAALAAVLHVLIPEARRKRPTPVSAGLYDLAQWQRLWELSVADPADRAAAAGEDEERPPADAPAVPAVCPYRGLAPYREQDAQWFFGRERGVDALVAQLRAAERSGGLVVLVGASGAGKSSLLNAGLVPTLQGGAPGAGYGPVVQLVPGAEPVGELTGRIPGLADAVADGDADTPRFAAAVRASLTAWAEGQGDAVASEGQDTPSPRLPPPPGPSSSSTSSRKPSPSAPTRRNGARSSSSCTPPARPANQVAKVAPATPTPPPPWSSSASAPTSTRSVSATPNWPTRSSTGTWCSAP
ncbi:hypothetical protein SMD44_04705 [Streptomyces alboflavus]|uniref:Novel STAND NTPase 1 domain-containing protein n=1 Tax=Streptomyces alboflavus TaxID=67267 RepID=A0A1Z1WFM3_9ACTN|nr:hypothetical protein SMD44_04705 [Streptomyces alboflavus]